MKMSILLASSLGVQFKIARRNSPELNPQVSSRVPNRVLFLNISEIMKNIDFTCGKAGGSIQNRTSRQTLPKTADLLSKLKNEPTPKISTAQRNSLDSYPISSLKRCVRAPTPWGRARARARARAR